MKIDRPIYLKKLIKRRNNGMAKIITGIRRCGKSYLLGILYRDWLIEHGVKDDHIIDVALDDIKNRELRFAVPLYEYISSLIKDDEAYYVFLDEIQLVEEFSDLVNGLLHKENIDIYVTGSNSRFLSSDILTEFRGRGDEVRIRPLSFSEFHAATNNTPEQDWRNYVAFGGMPQVASMADTDLKIDYLNNLYRKVYLTDIAERNVIRHSEALDTLVEVLASSIGSLVSFKKIADTFKSKRKDGVTDKTVKLYVDYLMDAFLFEQAKRYDIKGRKIIGATSKFYCEDIGLRNAILDFRQQEENHILENIVYLELKMRGFQVNVGQIVLNEKVNDKWTNKTCEVDFVANKGSDKVYIQCALTLPDTTKRAQEERPLLKVDDSFKKMIVTRDNIVPWSDDHGIKTIGILDFLLDEYSV